MLQTFMTGGTDRHWNQLLDYIEAGRVVPVLGRELLWTEIKGKRQNVYSERRKSVATAGGHGLEW